MRTEANRDELDKLLDMKAVDAFAEEVALKAMQDLAEKLMLVMIMCRRNPPTSYLLKVNHEKVFADIMLYSANKVINTINAKTEEGIELANKMAKDFFGVK